MASNALGINSNQLTANATQADAQHHQNPAPHGPRLPDWMTILTGVLAFFAVLSFLGLLWQIKESRKALVADQRAWVNVYVGEKAGNFAVTLNNTGKTPALKVTYTAGFRGGKRGVIPDLDLTTNSSSPVSANTSPEMVERLKQEGYIKDRPLSGYIVAPNSSVDPSLWKVRFSQFMAMPGSQVAYVEGRITYDDVFGGKHKTDFCYFADLPLQALPPGVFPESDFIMCKDHNAME